MKKMKLLFVSLMLLAFGVTSVSAQDYASTNTSNVTFTLGTKAYKEKMNIGGKQYDVVKLGTSSLVGDASFKIPAGTTTIHLHAVAWNGKTAQINFTASSNSVTLGTTSITPKSDSGAANNSPYTLAGDPTSYYYEITTSNVTAETTITMKTVSGKTRAIIWGVNTEIATTGDDDDAVMYTVTASVNDETMGSVSGAGKYAEGKTATLTANPNAGYKFVNWSNGETANPLKFTVTEDVEITANFAAIPPITCSQIKDLTIGEAFVLGEFTVTYVNGAYTYIKDATGASLIYSYNYGLKAGDVVTGLAGTRANFNGLVQINPTVTKAQLTITAGTAPQPEVATANPTQADMNKYVKYEQVTFDATAFSSKKINATLAGQTTKFAVYDQWSFNKTFVKGGTYEFIGAVSYYNAVQVNFISATKVSITISATATGGKVTGTGEYMEGEEATLIATANEGYEFVNWTWADEVVCTTPEYTFEVEEAVSLVANFAKKTYTVTATAENGSVAGLAADGKYEHGAEANLTATANEGYEFVSWTEGEEVVSTNAEYTFEVLADRNLVANFVEAAPEINYEEFIMSNLVVTTPAEGLEMLEASDPVNGISVMLGVYEDGTLHEDCLITFQGMELSIVSSEKVTKEYNEDVETDVYTVRVVVAFGGANMGLQLLMYATAAAEPIIINVEGATVTLTEYQISAEETAYELNMISNWVYEEDGLTYEVECLLPTFDPTKESGDYEASFFVRGEGNAFGMTEDAIVSVAKNGNQITLTGEITAYNNNVYNVTISGTLPVVEPTTITYELNGGELPKVKVPTNAELWGTDTADVNGLMHYFNHYHNLKRSAQDISADVSTNPVATFLTGMPDEAGVFVDEESKYKWLGDYIIKVTNDQIAEGKLSVLKAVDSNIKWRYGVQAFFMCLPATDSNYKGWADFTEAGKPEAWGAAYQAANELVLPTEPVDAPYTLPTPVKEGYKFVGWYDNAEGKDEPYTVIPAGWSGTLYAIWEADGPTTALDNLNTTVAPVKTIINGQLIIINNGVQYNALGQVIR